MKFRFNNKGFTLLEAMLAAVIGAFIALVAVGALRTVTGGREKLQSNIDASDELRYAAGMIRNDFANLYRDKDRKSVKFVGTIEDTDYGPVTSLTMRVVSSAKARVDQPESDVYEVQYFLKKGEDKSTLMRRQCPIVGIESDDETMGGILTAIAENIVDFEVQYYDGQEWHIEWAQDEIVLPGMVEVALISKGPRSSDAKGLVTKNFTVSFPRLPRMTETNSDNKIANNEK